MLPRFILAASLCATLPVFADDFGAPKKTDDRYPAGTSISDDAQAAVKKMAIAPGLQAEVWASEPLLENPVAMAFDDAGRAFVAETYRRRTSVPDIRKFEEWRIENLALRSVEDRVAFFKTKFPESAKARPTKDRADLNGDGQFDWRDLGVESERVRLVEDSNRDGKADQSRVFAEGFNDVATGVGAGVTVHGSEVFYTATPDLWRIHADGTKEKLFTGFGVHVAYSGHDMHGAKIGPDGRLYWSIADCGAHVTGKEGQVIDNPDSGAVFRCEPDGSHLELVARGLRNPQSLAWNDVGDLFTGDNNADGGDKARWVHVIEGADYGWRIGWQFLPKLGAWNSEGMWHLDSAEHHLATLPPVGHIGHGPSGIAYYPGTGLPDGYREHFFYADFPGGVRSFALTPRGSSYTVENPGDVLQDNKTQTLTGKVLWGLYPSDVAFAPGGGLYVLDWVQGWEKTGKGRIFRVFNPTADQAAEATRNLLNEGFAKRSVAELSKLLGHEDQRVRLGAQFELVKRGDARPLAQAAAESASRLARLHGISGVAQLARKQPDAAKALASLASDKDAEVRAQWAKFLGEAKVSGEAQVLVKLLGDPEPRVRFFAAEALGELGEKSAGPALIQLARETSSKDAHLRDAVSQALARIVPENDLAELAKHPSESVRACALLALGKLKSRRAVVFLDDEAPFIAENAARILYETRAFAEPAAQPCVLAMQGVTKDVSPAFELRAVDAGLLRGDEEIAVRFARVAANPTVPERRRVLLLNALRDWDAPIPRDPLTGLMWKSATSRGKAGPALKPVLPALLKDSSAEVRTAAAEAAGGAKPEGVDALLASTAMDGANPGTLRAAALRALGALDSPKLGDAVREALGEKDKTLLEAARQLAAKASPADAVKVNAEVLGKGSVREQQDALAIIAAQPGAEADTVIAGQLDALTTGKLPKGLWLDVLEAAAKRTDASVKAKLTAYEQTRKAGGVLAAWRECLEGGNAKVGREIFFEKAEAGCLRCHKIKGEGGDVGPDLAGLAKKQGREYVLRSIIDPNATIAKGFENVMVTLTDGSIAAGILSAEDDASVTLKSLVDGKPQKIEKAKVKERTAVPSAMPPGLGEVLGKRGLRDVVEFLAGVK